jgi:hypothetical protein
VEGADDVSPPPNVQAIETTSSNADAATIRDHGRPDEERDPAGDDIRRRVPDTEPGEPSDRGARPVWKAAAAYLVYQAFSFAVFGLQAAAAGFASSHVGIDDPDSRQYQWFLSWTPWALAHHLNPIHTASVFAPGGVSLSWAAFVPGPALLMWPVTAAFGPLASLNAILVAAPALAAWGAYLVAHRVTGRFWPSLVGGYLFGFSAYVVANVAGFVNLVLVFPIPLLVYLVIRHVEGSLGPVAFVAGFTALLVGLFSISTELFGTAAIFGAIAFAGAFLVATAIRDRLLRTGALILLSGAIAGLLLLPYILAVLDHTPPELFRAVDKMAAADLWSFVIPARYEIVGGTAGAAKLQTLTAYPRSNSLAYVGVAVLVLLAGFAITERRRRATWALLGFVALVWVLTLGRELHVGGRSIVSLPATLFGHIRIIQSAVPVRFSIYAALAIGVIAAIWLARAGGRSGWIRWAIAVAAVVSLIPRPPDGAPAKDEEPAFLASAEVRTVLHPGDVVYPITRVKGDEMLWLVEADQWFPLAQGYIGPIPPEVDTGPLADGLHVAPVAYDPSPTELSDWMRGHGVTAVVLDDHAARRYGDLLPAAGLEQVYAGGGASVWRPAASPATTGLG